MRSNLPNDLNRLFYLASRFLKYLLLALAGFAIAYILSLVFGVSPVANFLVSSVLWEWVLRISAFIFCLFAIAVVFESFR